MGRRRKKIIENVTITGIADKGMSVGRTDEGQVVFVSVIIAALAIYKTWFAIRKYRLKKLKSSLKDSIR